MVPLLNDTEALNSLTIVGEVGVGPLQEALVNFVDYLEVAGKKGLKHTYRPLL